MRVAEFVPRLRGWISAAAVGVEAASGSPWTILAYGCSVVAWVGSLPFLVDPEPVNIWITTGLTVLTQLQAMLISHGQARLHAVQRRENEALHAKLDRILIAHPEIENRLAGLERRTQEEIEHERREMLATVPGHDLPPIPVP